MQQGDIAFGYDNDSGNQFDNRLSPTVNWSIGCSTDEKATHKRSARHAAACLRHLT
jgi:hypothetical protein